MAERNLFVIRSTKELEIPKIVDLLRGPKKLGPYGVNDFLPIVLGQLPPSFVVEHPVEAVTNFSDGDFQRKPAIPAWAGVLGILGVLQRDEKLARVHKRSHARGYLTFTNLTVGFECHVHAWLSIRAIVKR